MTHTHTLLHTAVPVPQGSRCHLAPVQHVNNRTPRRRLGVHPRKATEATPQQPDIVCCISPLEDGALCVLYARVSVCERGVVNNPLCVYCAAVKATGATYAIAHILAPSIKATATCLAVSPAINGSQPASPHPSMLQVNTPRSEGPLHAVALQGLRHSSQGVTQRRGVGGCPMPRQQESPPTVRAGLGGGSSCLQGASGESAPLKDGTDGTSTQQLVLQSIGGESVSAVTLIC